MHQNAPQGSQMCPPRPAGSPGRSLLNSEGEAESQMSSGIPTFLQPIAGLLEGLAPSSAVVNLRHLTIDKPSIYMYHLLAIWEFGLPKSYFRNVIYIFIYSFIHCIFTYLFNSFTLLDL